MKTNFKAVFRIIENKRGQMMSLNKKIRSKISKERNQHSKHSGMKGLLNFYMERLIFEEFKVSCTFLL